MAEDMNKQIIEARRAYKKAWRKANKEKIAEYNRKFYAKYAERLKAEKAAAKSETVTG
jgi:hypothetical protein